MDKRVIDGNIKTEIIMFRQIGGADSLVLTTDNDAQIEFQLDRDDIVDLLKDLMYEVKSKYGAYEVVELLSDNDFEDVKNILYNKINV